MIRLLYLGFLVQKGIHVGPMIPLSVFTDLKEWMLIITRSALWGGGIITNSLDEGDQSKPMKPAVCFTLSIVSFLPISQMRMQLSARPALAPSFPSGDQRKILAPSCLHNVQTVSAMTE